MWIRWRLAVMATALATWSVGTPESAIARAAAADTSEVVVARAVATDSPASGASASPRARHAPPDSATITRLSLAIAGTRAVRVEMGSRAYVLLAPRVEPGGIGYDGLEHFPPPRPAVIAFSAWDTIPPPPRPIPWQQVSGLERRVETRRPAVIFGAAVGALLLGGFAYGFSRYGGEDQAEAWSHAVAGGAIGAGAGALLGLPFATPSWVREYPSPSEHGNPRR